MPQSLPARRPKPKPIVQPISDDDLGFKVDSPVSAVPVASTVGDDDLGFKPDTPKDRGVLRGIWEGFGGQTVVDLLGGASRDPQLAAKSRETAMGLVKGIRDEPARVWRELGGAGQAMVQGDLPRTAWHLGGAVPLLGARAQDITTKFNEGRPREALGETIATVAPILGNKPTVAAAREAGASGVQSLRRGAKVVANMAKTPEAQTGALEVAVGTMGVGTGHPYGYFGWPVIAKGVRDIARGFNAARNPPPPPRTPPPPIRWNEPPPLPTRVAPPPVRGSSLSTHPPPPPPPRIAAPPISGSSLGRYPPPPLPPRVAPPPIRWNRSPAEDVLPQRPLPQLMPSPQPAPSTSSAPIAQQLAEELGAEPGQPLVIPSGKPAYSSTNIEAANRAAVVKDLSESLFKLLQEHGYSAEMVSQLSPEQWVTITKTLRPGKAQPSAQTIAETIKAVQELEKLYPKQ